MDEEAKQREDADYITQYNAKKESTLDAVNTFQPPLPLDVLQPPLAPITSVSDLAPQREERHVVRAVSNPGGSSSVQREPLAPSSSPLPTVAPLPTPLPTVDTSPAPSLTPGPRRPSRTIRVPRWLSEEAVQEPIALATSRSDPDTLSFDEAMRYNSTEWMEAAVQEITQVEAHGKWREVSQLQPTVSLSTAESEYIALSQCTRMILPIREVILEITRNVDIPSKFRTVEPPSAPPCVKTTTALYF